MSNEKKKKLKFSLNVKYLIAVLIIGTFLYKYSSAVEIFALMIVIIGYVVIIYIVVISFGILLYIKNKISEKIDSIYHPERSEKVASQRLMREKNDQKAQAVKCTHSTGREKYIQQLDEYLANGLIDKNEYRMMKERYEKLDIPDNMH